MTAQLIALRILEVFNKSITTSSTSVPIIVQAFLEHNALKSSLTGR